MTDINDKFEEAVRSGPAGTGADSDATENIDLKATNKGNGANGGQPASDLIDLDDPPTSWPATEPANGGSGAGTGAEEQSPFALRTRQEQRKAWRQTEKDRREAARSSVRYPFLTRSVTIWVLIFLAAGIAFGASAAFWWSIFNTQVSEIRDDTLGLSDQIANASGQIEQQRSTAIQQIGNALDGLENIVGPQLAVATAGQWADSVWLIETLDQDGVASAGTAFVVSSDDQQSVFLTSLDVVQASTVAPGPDIVLSSAGRQISAQLWNWDEGLDLAVLVAKDPNLPPLEWASQEQAANALASGVYVLSGAGGGGAAASPGIVLDQSTSGIQHNAAVGTAYRGGPIMTGDSKVLAVASTAFEPLGFDPGDVRFAVPVDKACDSGILSCRTSSAPDAGDQRGG